MQHHYIGNMLLFLLCACVGLGCQTAPTTDSSVVSGETQPGDKQLSPQPQVTTTLDTGSTAASPKQGKKLYVIVHKDNDIVSITKQDLKNIYLGKQLRWPNLITIERYDYPPARQVFYEQILKMPLLEVARYWNQQKVMGGYRRPITMERMKELFLLFRREKGAVAYVTTANLPKEVRILAEFDIKE